MRRRGQLTFLAAAAAVVGGLLTGGVSPATAGAGTSGFSSDNVEQVKFVPFEVGTATGARVVGKYLFVTSWKNFSIYDIKDPLNPTLIKTQPIGFMFENEDVATNGKMLMFSESLPGNALHIWDLQDYNNPKEVGTLSGVGDHTTSCLLGCKYGWGSEGSATDLRRIDAPKKLGKWNTGQPGKSIHDVTEVAPGLVVTASQPIMFLDARKSITEPRLLATGSNSDKRFIHSIRWPRAGKDRFLLAGGETNATQRCSESSAKFMVWDTTNWRKKQTFTMSDQYKYTNGVWADGNPGVNGLGCSAHWFQEHPTFNNGGLVAVGSYEHGTKFLTVSKAGKLKEVGWFVPLPGGSQSAAYWITKDLVYTIDYSRGIDILRYKGPLK